LKPKSSSIEILGPQKVYRQVMNPNSTFYSFRPFKNSENSKENLVGMILEFILPKIKFISESLGIKYALEFKLIEIPYFFATILAKSLNT